MLKASQCQSIEQFSSSGSSFVPLASPFLSKAEYMRKLLSCSLVLNQNFDLLFLLCTCTIGKGECHFMSNQHNDIAYSFVFKTKKALLWFLELLVSNRIAEITTILGFTVQNVHGPGRTKATFWFLLRCPNHEQLNSLSFSLTNVTFLL